MMDRFEILYSKLRRLVSRNRWSARLLGYPPVPHSRDDGVGLVLIQIDGLGRKVLDRALEEGRMPFLRHLIQDDGYRLRDLYSGLPSSTPGAQAELFYRARTFVPAFGFWDREVGKVVRMNDPSTAARVESELVQEHDGLMKRGSAWSNIYAGEAAEPGRRAARVATVGEKLAHERRRAAEHGRGVELALQHFLLDHRIERTRHAVAGGAGKGDHAEAKFLQLRQQMRFL